MAEVEDYLHLSIVQRTNRALRKINRTLRRQLSTARQNGDEMFLELCNTDIAASAAMRELWEKAGFECSPEDYDYIVDVAIRALRMVPGTSPNLIPQT